MTIVYLLLAIIPAVLIGMYLYKKDFNKESKGLLIKLFLGGIGSAIVTLLVSMVGNSILPGLIPTLDGTVEYNIIELFIKVLIGIALIEELCKWFFAYRIGYKSIEFDEVYDVILYCGFVALGFATFENILYVFTSDNTMQTAILRAVTAVPGHVCDAVFMGYYLGLAKQYEVSGNLSERKKYMILSIAIPMLTHGIYDFLVLSGSGLLLIVWFIFVIGTYIYVIKKIREVSKARKTVYQPVSNMPTATVYFSQNNNYRPTYNTFGQNSMYNNQNNDQNNNFVIKYCPNCGHYEPEANFCSQCGTKIK